MLHKGHSGSNHICRDNEHMGAELNKILQSLALYCKGTWNEEDIHTVNVHEPEAYSSHIQVIHQL
jgi:hypothetical protein